MRQLEYAEPKMEEKRLYNFRALESIVLEII